MKIFISFFFNKIPEPFALYKDESIAQLKTNTYAALCMKFDDNHKNYDAEV
jgi:hypothetical protein